MVGDDLMVCCALIPTPGYLRFYFGLPKTARAISCCNKQRALYSRLLQLEGLRLFVSHWYDEVKVEWIIFTLGWNPSVVTWDKPFF